MSSFKEKLSQFFERKADNAAERINHTPTNKLILIVLVLFAVGSVAIGALQVKAFLDKPFFSDSLVEDKGKIRGPLGMIDYIREQKQTNDAITKMQGRDTDGDGLNDYDEVYVYHTNPYTKFTNGGDKSDKELVDSGEWKNGCIGTNCDSSAGESTTTVSNANLASPDTATNIVTTLANPVNTSVTTGIDGLVPISNINMTSVAIKELTAQLLASGQLSQLTVEQKAELRTYFQNITTQDLRLMLVNQGFEQQKLDMLSDADIQQIISGLSEGLK